MNPSPLGRPALYLIYTGREQFCVLLRLSTNSPLAKLHKKRILTYFICYTASSGCETYGLCELLHVNVWLHVRRTARSILSPSHRVLFGLVQVVIRLPSKTTVLIISVPVNTQA